MWLNRTKKIVMTKSKFARLNILSNKNTKKNHFTSPFERIMSQVKYVQLDQFDYDSFQKLKYENDIEMDENSLLEDETYEHKKKKKKTYKSLKCTELSISGMNCSSCTYKVENHLKSIPEVDPDNVSVNLISSTAKVTYDSAGISAEYLAHQIESLGFKAKVLKDEPIVQNSANETIDLDVFGMACSSCASKIESTLNEMPGVINAVVNLMSNTATVSYDAAKVGKRDLVETIQKLGFNASVKKMVLIHDLSEKYDAEISIWKKRFMWSLILFLPVFAITMLAHLHPALGDPTTDHMDMKSNTKYKVYLAILLCLLTTPIHFLCGLHFHKSAFKALKAGYADMNVLLSLGTNSAYFFSLALIIQQIFSSTPVTDKLFFETTAMIILFQNLGKLLETYAKKSTSSSISELARLQAKTALIIKPDKDGEFSADSEEHEVDIELVQKEDFIKVLPGERIPADGVIVSGTSSVDESMLTGEYESVHKKKGDAAIGGTLNIEGAIIIRVKRTGTETMLSQIVSLVKDAQSSKAPIQKFADRISQIFVPVVIGISILTFLVWLALVKMHIVPTEWISHRSNTVIYSLEYAMAVLVIACPCALGLATPTAVMVSTGVGAKMGILIKGGEPLEIAHNISAIVFDKTGTLTEGRPSVMHHSIFDSSNLENELDFFIMVQIAESGSEHPIGKSLFEYCKEMSAKRLDIAIDKEESNFVFQSMQVITAEGVQCTILDKRRQQIRQVYVGKKELLERNIIQLSENSNLTSQYAEIQKQAELGRSVVLVGIDDKLVGFFALYDTVKPEARHVVSILHRMGIKTLMVSGDRQQCAQVIGKKVGIKKVFAEMLPTQKVSQISKLQRQGHTVAMVGDGINDSPSLARADIGIAIGAGSDIAIQSADIILVKNNLLDILTAIDLSRCTYNRIRLNHIWACGYNILLIPFACGIMYPLTHIVIPPHLAAALMMGSSLLVMISSLLLKRYQKKSLKDYMEQLPQQMTKKKTSPV
jgi:Cu+-exporting ATPase